MAKRVRYDVIPYGAWTRPRMRNFRDQCCDCGLIHRLDFRIVDDGEGEGASSQRGSQARSRSSSGLTKGRSRPSSKLTKGRSRPSSGLKIEFRTRRDDRATAAARRTFKFAPDE
jgi:hypothetical protein